MPKLVLASDSKYRAEILSKLLLPFSVCTSDVDETPLAHELPQDLALRLSKAKALAVAGTFSEHLIIGSDQVAVCAGQLLGKPGNKSQAIEQLKMQSAQIVHFYTGLCLLNTTDGQVLTALDVTEVHFKVLSNAQIERYVALDQPFDCAGSFKSEGLGISLFSKIMSEDPNALVGLPLIKLIDLLNKQGLELP